MELVLLFALVAFIFWTPQILKNTYDKTLCEVQGHTPRKEEKWLWHKR